MNDPQPKDGGTLRNALPSVFSGNAEKFPTDIVGARILAIGSPTESQHYEGGGLVIEYTPASSLNTMRIVLEFTEIGMYISYHGVKTTQDGES